MTGLRWPVSTGNVIVDFDTGTDTDGNFDEAKEPLGERQALRLSALDESPTLTRRSTLWMAAAGLDSRPTTSPSVDWRDWSRSKVPQLQRIMGELAGITEPAPVTLVVLGGGARYVATTCEIVDRAFTDRVEYVFASPNPELWMGIADDFGASSVTISLSDICQGLREIQQDSGLPKETLFPRLEAGAVPIDPARARWLEEQLELVHLDVASVPDDQTEEDSFLKGATISWDDLNGGVDAARDITPKLEQRVRRELNERATRRVNLWYRPGAGATTVARRIAWNIHRDFPTVVALDIQPQETAARIRHLFTITRLPILVVIDFPGANKEVVDRLYDALRSWHVYAVLFNVERRFSVRSDSGVDYLDAMLTRGEAFRISRVLTVRVPDRRPAIRKLISERDRRKRSPFYFGLTAYGRDFRGLESYVDTRLSRDSNPIDDAVLLMAFAYYYGQVPLSLTDIRSAIQYLGLRAYHYVWGDSGLHARVVGGGGQWWSQTCSPPNR